MGEDKKERRPEAGGEREEGEAAKHMEPGWEQPGKQRNQSGSTGSGAAQEIVTRERPRIREEGAAAAARTEKECMNRGQERWRERTRKNERREGGGEGEAGARNPDWNIRGSNAPRLEHPGGGSPGLERPGRQQPGSGTSGTSEEGGNGGGEQRRGAREQHGPAWTR